MNHKKGGSLPIERELNRSSRLCQYPPIRPLKKYLLAISKTHSGAIKGNRALYSDILTIIEENKDLPKNGLINFIFDRFLGLQISKYKENRYGHIEIEFKTVKRNYDTFCPTLVHAIKNKTLTGTTILRAIGEVAASNWLGGSRLSTNDLSTKDLYLIFRRNFCKETIKRGRKRLMGLGQTYNKGARREYLQHRFHGWISSLIFKDHKDCFSKQIRVRRNTPYFPKESTYNPYFRETGPPISIESSLLMEVQAYQRERESGRFPNFRNDPRDFVIPFQGIGPLSASHPWSAPPVGRVNSWGLTEEEENSLPF